MGLHKVLNDCNVHHLIPLDDFKDILHVYVQQYTSIVNAKHYGILGNDITRME